MNPLATRRRSGVSVFQFFSFSGLVAAATHLRPAHAGLRFRFGCRGNPSPSAAADSGSVFRFQASSFIPSRSRSGFTLIELLVVIAIIAVLAGLGFAGMQGAMESSKRAQARNDVHQIASAVKAYLLEFGKLPASNPIPELTGDNPKKIVFLEAKNAKNGKGGLDGGSMKDPWGKEYVIELDTDYDNKVRGHLTSVVVETSAPDGKKINNVQ